MKTCTQDDPNRDECLKQMFQEFLSSTTQGYSDIGIPPLDPFLLNRTTFNFKRPGSEGRIELKSLLTIGFSQAIVEKAKSNLDLSNKIFLFECDLRIPEVQTEGNYKASILLNNQRLKPKGYMNITASKYLIWFSKWVKLKIYICNVFNEYIANVDLKINVTSEIIERNELEYIKVISIDIEPKIDDAKFYATGIAADSNLSKNNNKLYTINITGSISRN